MLREAWTYHGDDQLSAPEYLKRYGHLINGAGQFLKATVESILEFLERERLQ
jgi:hypothetical protein